MRLPPNPRVQAGFTLTELLIAIVGIVAGLILKDHFHGPLRTVMTIVLPIACVAALWVSYLLFASAFERRQKARQR